VKVLLAFADVALGVQLQEALEAHRLTVRWDGKAAAAPQAADDVVILDADEHGARLAAIADAWRAVDPAPGLIAIGQRADAADHATAARCAFTPTTAHADELAGACAAAARLRFASAMTPGLARRALGLSREAADPLVMQAARSIDIAIPRAALAWHAHHYVCATSVVADLRDARALVVPEIELVQQLDGTQCVQTLVKLGALDAYATARLIWALASVGAATITPEPPDVGTPRRRALAELREHVRARMARLEKSTYYDVLEVSPLAEYDEIERAYQLCARRYAPAALAAWDLADLAPLARPLWELVEKARAVLVDLPSRGRYNDWLAQRMSTLRTSWAIPLDAAQTAGDAFARGLRALGDGDVHRALSDFAAACRQHPDHPEYEVHLCWARYRVEVAAGKDKAALAKAERAKARAYLLGTRPWPRAWVALALLCAADGDVDAARWHVGEALAIDPTLPAAQQLVQRLGMR
jgi:hypothetical protein